jgi:hypothetical protein
MDRKPQGFTKEDVDAREEIDPRKEIYAHEGKLAIVRWAWR